VGGRGTACADPKPPRRECRACLQGAGAGLGFETARVLARAGGRVFMAARTQAAAEDAVARVRAALGAETAAELHPLSCDLSSLAAVDAAAAAFLAASRTLDVLICNAGVMACPLTVTVDGLETQHCVNHVAHQRLVTLLTPALAAAGTASRPARVVAVSSMGNWLFALPCGVDFERLPPDAKTYNPWTRYAQTKLANILMARHVTTRAAAAKQAVFGVALHPGVIMGTTLARHFGVRSIWVMLVEMYRRGTIIYGLTQQNKSVAQGAATQVLCALDPAVKPSGYYVDCAEEPSAREGGAIHPRANDAALAKLLWEHTEGVVAEAAKKREKKA
jgi:NAD(P)-dependent dehydrogenase (short-subunit alcohol dehydrogenase family)